MEFKGGPYDEQVMAVHDDAVKVGMGLTIKWWADPAVPEWVVYVREGEVMVFRYRGTKVPECALTCPDGAA